MRAFSSALALILVTSSGLTAQDAIPFLQDAQVAWRAGNYIRALETLQRVLDGPAAAEALPAIAELTGEWYRVSEIARDGRNPRWSADGRYAVFETGDGDSVQTHVVAVDGAGPREVATIAGHSLTFAPQGQQAAFLRLDDGPALERARTAIRERVTIRDRESFQRYRVMLRRAEAAFTDVYRFALDRPSPVRVPIEGWGILELLVHRDGQSAFAVAVRDDSDGPPQLVRLAFPDGRVTPVDGQDGVSELRATVDGSALVFRGDDDRIGILDLETSYTETFSGTDASIARDGRWLAYLDASGDTTSLLVRRIGESEATVLTSTTDPLASPAVSPSGNRVAYQRMSRENWEIWLASTREEPRRITYDVQHDLFPVFVDEDRLLVIKGEGRHRRSYLYDVDSGRETRLFHNNTVRTVAPEYAWAVHPDATSVLIVSERDGDTISPERGLYVARLNETVSIDEVRARVRDNLASERDLRERGEQMFAPIHAAVADAVAGIDVERVYQYERDLFRFGSKFITRPGNRQAIEYLQARLREFGYEAELQWFEPRPGLRSANVIATLPGTANPDLIYVISSHFDSVERGPGADDNTSGTSALLEVARVMASRRMPATIQFAFFTGEEAGLLGSREFVRRAVESGEHIVGALNNDMVGYANDERLDNTIRYSNSGIRDLQHAAASLFTRLITYDAKYYKSTDAHAYYEAYGDIVGGIGSYPILANPHYHQTHDVLETINHQLVAEVAKTTVASIMLLAASPARITDLAVESQQDGALRLSWAPAPEADVSDYVVAYGPDNDPFRDRTTTPESGITLEIRPDVTRVAVKARNARGHLSWDWAHVSVGPVASDAGS